MKANAPNQRSLSAGPELRRRVRAGLLVHGVTLTDWCQENGTSRQFAYQCLTGKRAGITATHLLDRLTKAAHLS